MTTNSNFDKLHEGDGSGHDTRNWEVMAERALKCPGITVLDRWVDNSLEELEKEFSAFTTLKSNRRNLGR